MELDAIRYNPELCGYEALARFRENGEVLTYPVFVAAPLRAEFGLVAQGLAQKARAAHSAPQKGMVMRRPDHGAQRRPAAAQAAIRLLSGLLGSRHAA